MIHSLFRSSALLAIPPVKDEFHEFWLSSSD